MFVEFVDTVEKNWNGLSKDTNVFLWSAESESWAAKVGAENLNPVGLGFSSKIGIDFIINIELIFQAEVIEMSLFSSFTSHDFVKGWSLDFIPVFDIVVETFCFGITASHCLVRYYLNKYDFIDFIKTKIKIDIFIFHS